MAGASTWSLVNFAAFSVPEPPRRLQEAENTQMPGEEKEERRRFCWGEPLGGKGASRAPSPFVQWG